MSDLRFLVLVPVLTMAACDRQGEDVLPNPGDVPEIIEIGELRVLTAEEFADFQSTTDPASWCGDTSKDPEGLERPGCYYGNLASTAAAFRGGATFTYKGTGEPVCLIADPETVFWNQSIAASGPNESYTAPDQVNDDGDIDIFSGLSSYYTGSPGVEIGDFLGFYTDSQGRDVEIEFGACFQTGSSLSGIQNAHSGRGALEFCTVDTSERAGVEYTAVLETFSVPFDDGALSFAAAVVEGPCFNLNECTLIAESRAADAADNTGEGYNTCAPFMELAMCQDQLTPFCCANPDMCGEMDTVEREEVCENAFNILDRDGTVAQVRSRDEWCSDTNLCCGGNFEAASNN